MADDFAGVHRLDGLAQRLKPLDLPERAGGIRLVGGRHVRKAAGQRHAGQAVDQPRQRLRFLRRAHADAVHARIQLEVHLRASAELLPRLRQRADAALVKDHLRQIVLHDGLRRALLDAAEHENRRGNARLPQLDALLGDGDGQHIRPRLQRRLRDGRRPVSVCVRLDDGQKPRAARNAAFHHADVVADRRQINFTKVIPLHDFSSFLF